MNSIDKLQSTAWTASFTGRICPRLGRDCTENIFKLKIARKVGTATNKLRLMAKSVQG